MKPVHAILTAVAASSLLFRPTQTRADIILYNNDIPLNLIATATTPSGNGFIEHESADDFILQLPTRVKSATFTGLVPAGATVQQVVVEIYRVFPKDSTDPPDGRVPTRTNSPSDVEFAGRDSVGGSLSFTTNLLASTFTANNSVINGINPFPSQTTGGEGAVTGQEIRFNVSFNTPIDLPADHYFFVPQVLLGGATTPFLWLSGPRPPTITPFAPDLQSWIRDANLDPDWLRVGMDIVGGSPAPTFNAAFSLTGEPDRSRAEQFSNDEYRCAHRSRVSFQEAVHNCCAVGICCTVENTLEGAFSTFALSSMGRGGIEPPTHGFSVRCSTN